MPPRTFDPSSDPAERPHSARGRLGAVVDRCVGFLISVAEFRRHERPSIDGTPCVRCTARAEMERDAFPMVTTGDQMDNVTRRRSLLERLGEMSPEAKRLICVSSPSMLAAIARDVVRHVSVEDCPLAGVGDCDVCLTVVDVVGLDGCAVGVNHRVMNIRPRGATPQRD